MKRILLFALFTIVFTFSINAQSKFAAKNNLKIELKKVQDLYFKRDYEGGSALAKKLLSNYPDDLELKAWHIMNLARNRDSFALETAEKFIQERGENLWTLLVLTTAQTYNKAESAIATSEKLIKIAPTDEEAIFAYDSALFQNNKEKESIEWLEKNKNKIKDQSRFFTALASSTYYVERKKEKGDNQKAFNFFSQAVKLNPNSVNANYQYGVYLTMANRSNEAIPFLQKAVQLSPNVPGLRSYYWGRLESQANKTEVQKKAEVERSINQYLTQTKNSPQALLAAWNKYRDWSGWKETAKPEDVKMRDYFETLILQKYPNTKFDEEVAFVEIRSVYGKYFAKDEGAKNLEIRLKRKSKRTPEETKFFEEYKQREKTYQDEEIVLRRAYLKRPKHFDLSKLGNVYLNLFYQLVEKKDSTDEEISALLKGTLEHNKNYYSNLNSHIAAVLFNRQKVQPESVIAKEAEKYARLGIEHAEKQIKELPKDAKQTQIYELRADSLNTLAEILIKQEKLDEAEKLLNQASAMKDDSGGQNHVLHYANIQTDQLWAKFYASKKDWTKAEEFYIKSSGEDEDVVKTIFENFYEKKNGKKDGFDAYFAGVLEKIKLIAKEKALQSRIKEPKEMIPFALKTIEDKTVSSADLKGKVIVINVWGVWCGPCVAEMPELQKVYDKYKDDKDVAILTIDEGDELAKIKKFIEEKKYTLPVLMSDGYIDKTPQFSSGGTFPTTLFIDKSGKVSFIVVGASSDLIETFSWRIDVLKEDK